MVEDEARNRLGAIEADAFLTRLEQLSVDISEPLSQVYGAVTDAGKFAAELVLDALHAAAERPAALRLLDRRREIDPAWFQRSRMIGYVCYTDRFAGTLARRRCVYGCWGWSSTRAVGPRSTTVPRCSTSVSSVSWRTTARSWLIRM